MVDSTPGQRFLQLIQHLGISKNAFALSLDRTATVIQHLVDERNKPGFDLICKVFEVYPNVSKDWLLMGDGPMLLADTATTATAAVAAPIIPAKPMDVIATPSFPAPLFAVSSARLAASVPAVAAPAAAEQLATPPTEVPASIAPAQATPEAAPAAQQPGAAPAASAPAAGPATAATPPPTAPDAAYLTAALHAQYLQHQLVLAEQRNQHLVALSEQRTQHLLEQQALMQQMIQLLQRPA